LAFGPEGQLAAVSENYAIAITRLGDTAPERNATLTGHSWAIRVLQFSPDPRFAYLASASADGSVRIWDVRAARELLALPYQADVISVAFSHDGRRLLTGGWDHSVKVWDAHTGQLQDNLADPTGGVRSVVFHPTEDGVLAWGSTDSTVKVWNRASTTVRTLHGHTSWVESVAFSPDGEWIASGSLDGTIKLWQMPNGSEVVAQLARPGPSVAVVGEKPTAK
jgi:WD40 repeat protein